MHSKHKIFAYTAQTYVYTTNTCAVCIYIDNPCYSCVFLLRVNKSLMVWLVCCHLLSACELNTVPLLVKYLSLYTQYTRPQYFPQIYITKIFSHIRYSLYLIAMQLLCCIASLISSLHTLRNGLVNFLELFPQCGKDQ